MTTMINSLCIKCKILEATTCVITQETGERGILSYCVYGGRNAGNRKTCKNFIKNDENVTAERIKILKGGADK